jgi:hypothetical protein
LLVHLECLRYQSHRRNAHCQYSRCTCQHCTSQKALDEINRAKAYPATDNYLPLVGLVNVTTGDFTVLPKELRCILKIGCPLKLQQLDPPEAD